MASVESAASVQAGSSSEPRALEGELTKKVTAESVTLRTRKEPPTSAATHSAGCSRVCVNLCDAPSSKRMRGMVIPTASAGLAVLARSRVYFGGSRDRRQAVDGWAQKRIRDDNLGVGRVATTTNEDVIALSDIVDHLGAGVHALSAVGGVLPAQEGDVLHPASLAEANVCDVDHRSMRFLRSS